MNFLYGINANDMNIGLGFSFALDSWYDNPGGDNPETSENAHYLSLKFGASNKIFDFGLNLKFPGAKKETTNSSQKIEESWSGYGVDLNGRVFIKRGKLKIVHLAKFTIRPTKATQEIPSSSGTEVQETSFNKLALALGVAFNYQLDDNNLIVVAFEPYGLRSDKKEIESGDTTTNTTIIAPGIYAGVESKIKSWCTGRFGAVQTHRTEIHTIKPDQGDETETSTHYKDFAMTFGLGFNFGKFTLDAYINEGLFFDGPNFISGSNEPLASKLSLTYKF